MEIVHKVDPAMSHADAANILRGFISTTQLRAMVSLCSGEEGAFFMAKLRDYASRVSTMPKTYEQDEKGDEAVAFLHYFVGSYDCYIIEKDSDPDGLGQVQAFGYASFGDEFEAGYISISEITDAGAEMDLHFTPATIGELKASGKIK